MRHSLSLLCILPLLILAFFAEPTWASEAPAPLGSVPSVPVPAVPLTAEALVVIRDEEIAFLRQRVADLDASLKKIIDDLGNVVAERDEARAAIATLTEQLATAKAETASTFACAQADRDTIETLRAAIKAGKEVSPTKVW